ncbi:MAG: M28 family peptidase [Siphonobacter sp.]
MKQSLSFLLALCTLAGFLQSCKEKAKNSESTTQEVQLAAAPTFNADSAYAFVQKQVDFGPRIPNSKAHQACGDWLAAKLKSYGFSVTEQKFTETAYDGTKLNGRNIIGSTNPEAAKRILLAAHWDTRPFADKDTDPKYKDKPFDGANDGGSGVGVLLEIARNIQSKSLTNVGIDIIFFDAEDWGEKEGVQPSGNKNYWALGSQYWAKNLHKPGYSAYYGILLDLVGAKGAQFPQEGGSMQYAPSVVQNIWSIASRLGYDQYFISVPGGGLNDDHTAVNEVAKIPMVDIVEMKPNNPKTFGDYHHTHSDNMQVIDKGVMKAVGQTVTQVLYQEN